VETGSFNFTKAAETKNSENAVVIWNMPKLAESFLEHWQDRWNRGRDYRSSY
ncbi:phospholipase D family protein, partial [Enterobacter hormaechei]|nr:phospholipase D family protein [Enterobacter hormaechei]MDQ2222509.1 phospholipase D family protein [Enterobacter roggenkampii]MBQ0194136.1 phospholipase D family protein [Enterobacter hormaechei]MBQ0202772.1 phospholipase D family protein [Enterobacter hormaechei]MBQ0257402.1 phospholipase D family protein [Enterobacter hormaechei]